MKVCVAILVLAVAACANPTEAPVTETTVTETTATETTATEVSSTQTAATETSTATAATSSMPAASSGAGCTPGKLTLCPVDEGSGDPSFAAYRAKLLSAVEHKSEKELLPLLDPKIRTNFGGGGGIADFKGQWKPSSPDSKLWPELTTILNHGGSFLGETREAFWAPYVYSKWPDDVDAFEHVAALRGGVPVRASASETASTVTTLNWKIARIVGRSEGWLQVETADGKKGWVRATDVRSPLMNRAGFNKVKGEWRMTGLVAGD